MKKILTLMIIGLLCFSMFSIFTPKTKAEGTTIFTDNFESYPLGTFPSSGGWVLWFSGAGDNMIVNTYYVSPTKSLQLHGQYGWAGGAARYFDTTPQVVGYEVSMMAEEIRHDFSPQCGFNRRTDPANSISHATVAFYDDDQSIRTVPGGYFLQSYEPGRWYRIKVILDKATETFSVWIDDVPYGTFRDVPNSNEIEAFYIQAGWSGVRCYFDDVEVFSATIVPPTKWAVVLGDSEYTDANNPVKGAINSANDMYNLLVYKFGFPPSNVHLQTDAIGNSADNINTADIKDELDWLASKVRLGDTAVFYYAGHGGQTNGHEYLVPHDQIGIIDSDFAFYINKIRSDKLLVILDFSFAGGFVTDGQSEWQGLLGIIPSWTDVASGTPSNRVVLTACAENTTFHIWRLNLDRDAKWQGFWHYDTGWRYEMVFTHYLTMGFLGSADSNGNGKVTVEEAFRFAKTRAMYTQTPLMYDGYPAYGLSGDFYLG